MRSRRGYVVTGTFLTAAAAAAVVLVSTLPPGDEEPLPAGAPTAVSGPDDAQPVAEATSAATIESMAGTAAPDPVADVGAATDSGLDPYSIVILPVDASNGSDEAKAAAIVFHDRFVSELAGAGFIVMAGEAAVPHLAAGFDEIEVAHVLGAGSVAVISILASGTVESVKLQFFDANTGLPNYSYGINVRLSPFDSFFEPEGSNGVRSGFQFESLVAALNRRAAPETPQPPAPNQDQVVASSMQTLLDTSMPERERSQALALMRGAQGSIQEDAAIHAAIALAAESSDSNIRGTVWQQLRGADKPYLIQPLLAALETETDDFPRQMAVTALGDYLDDPSVRSALESVARDDPSAQIRDVAAAATLSESELHAMIKSRVLDSELSADKRLRALTNPFGDMRFGFADAIPIDTEVAGALVDIGSDTSVNASLRSSALGRLSNASFPGLSLTLLTLLEHDAEAQVRSAAARALTSHAGDPAVRAALEATRDSDIDPDVRSNARQALIRAEQ